MLLKNIAIGALIALASITTAHANSNIRYHGPSLGLSIGNGIDVRIGHGYTGYHYPGNRFKGQRISRGFNRGHSKGYLSKRYKGKRLRSNSIDRGQYNGGRRILGGSQPNGHRRYR